ncbi:MAG: hypothetical protein KDC70_06210 [Saprospiraceae bacterium]|nr:hypothetical protein [Saprospiraceae bacterium]
MTPSTSNLPRRYPGLKPFDRTQSAVFYGRREDVVRLTNLIVQQRLVVLFAKSGIGKTSLLQAGVAQGLESQNLAPIFIRLDNPGTALTATVGETLEKNAFHSGRNETGKIDGLQETLWERMKRNDYDIDGLPATPVLVFDQFEEVFTLSHSDQSRRQFLIELADLINESMPELIRSALMDSFRGGDDKMTASIMHWWERQPDLRIVISIRSDFLHLLDEISPLIPGILRNRYQLQPLNRKQAEEAIAMPADSTGGPFASPRFTYHPDAMEQIINFLAGHEREESQASGEDFALLKRQDEIESFNLQILCQYVEEKIIREGVTEGFEVTTDFYNAQAGLEREIRDFYTKQLDLLPEAFARRTGKVLENPAEKIAVVRRLIEESLVTPNDRRCSMVDDYLIDSYPGVDQEFLDVLVDSRLLRKENRLEDFYYEISHDTLLPAVIESRDKRRQQERAAKEKEEYEAKLAEQATLRKEAEDQLAAMRKQRRMARMVAATSLITLLVSLGFGVWFTRDYISSTRDQLNNARLSAYSELFGASIPSYEELGSHPWRCWVLEHTKPPVKVSEELEITRRFKTLYETVEDSLIRGDGYFFRDDYAQALSLYYEAKDIQNNYNKLNWEYSAKNDSGRIEWRVDTTLIRERFNRLGYRIENARKALIKEFKIRQRDFEAFYEANVWGQAMRNLERMQSLLPKEEEDIEKLKRELNLEEDPRNYVRQEMEKVNAGLRKIRTF